MGNEILIITGPAGSGKSLLAGCFARTAKQPLRIDGRNERAIKRPRWTRLVNGNTDLIIIDDISPGYARQLKVWLKLNMLHIKDEQGNNQIRRPRTILVFSQEVDIELIKTFSTHLPIVRLTNP